MDDRDRCARRSTFYVFVGILLIRNAKFTRQQQKIVDVSVTIKLIYCGLDHRCAPRYRTKRLSREGKAPGAKNHHSLVELQIITGVTMFECKQNLKGNILGLGQLN